MADPTAQAPETPPSKREGYGFAKRDASVRDIANQLAKEDRYGFHAAAVEKISAEVEAHRPGSVGEPPPQNPASHQPPQDSGGLLAAALSPEPAATVDDPAVVAAAEEAAQTGGITSLNDLAQALELDVESLLDIRTATRTSDGQEIPVSLRELLSSHRQQGHITRQQQELAREREKARTEHAAQQQKFDELLAQKTQTLDLARKMFLKEVDKVDWDKLRNEDPNEFLLRRYDYEKQREALNEAIAEHKADLDARAAQQQATYKEYEAREFETLMAKVPEWADNALMKKEGTQISQYMNSMGFSPEEIAQVTDHRHMLILRDAARYRALKGGAASNVTPISTRPVIRTTPRSAALPVTQKALEAARAAFKKSGDVRDLPALMAAERAAKAGKRK